jgi:hypothetical protein
LNPGSRWRARSFSRAVRRRCSTCQGGRGTPLILTAPAAQAVRMSRRGAPSRAAVQLHSRPSAASARSRWARGCRSCPTRLPASGAVRRPASVVRRLADDLAALPRKGDVGCPPPAVAGDVE